MTAIELSTLDYVFSMGAFEPISFVFHYQAELDVERILDAFYETAQRFPGVCGVLAQRDPYTFYLDVSRLAAQMVVGSDAGGRRIDVVEPELGKPLARVRITRSGAETSIGFSLSHVIGDAYSYFMFLASWAAQCRHQVLIEPSYSRMLLRAPQGCQPPAQPCDGELEYSGLFLDRSQKPPMSLEFVPEPLDVSTFASNKELGLSSNDLLSAALWKRATSADETRSTTFCSVVDIRRFRPELGTTFFGNAALIASATADAKALQAAPLEEVAGWIRASISELPDRIDRALVELESLRLCEGVEVFRQIRSLRASGMLVTNISRLPYAALDFGAGPPSNVEPVLSPAPGPCAAVLPAMNNNSPQVLVARAPR